MSENVSIDAVVIPVVPKKANEIEVWPDNGFITISGELIYYDDVEKNTNSKIVKFKKCIRGLENPARSHTKGTPAYGMVVAQHHNQLAEAIVTLEKTIGDLEESIKFSDLKQAKELQFVSIDVNLPIMSMQAALSSMAACPPISDDACPDVEFISNVLSTSPTVIEFCVRIFGSYSSYRLDFGDGNFTTTEFSGTYTYSGGTVDPKVTVRSSKCCIVQQPTTSEENCIVPELSTPSVPFVVTIPECPDFPSFIAPSSTRSCPGPLFNLPPIVIPGITCSEISGISETTDLCSIIVSVVGCCIPSEISVVGCNFPSRISIDCCNIPSRILCDCPSVISVVGCNFPSTISFECCNIPSEISVVGCNFPSQISVVGLCDLPSVISLDCCSLPSSISIECCDIPSQISVVGCDFPSSISIDCCSLPSSISIECCDIPSQISLIGCDIPSSIAIDCCNLPSSISIECCDIPSQISLIGCDIPSSIAIDCCNLPTMISIECCDLPTMISIECCDLPTVISIECCDLPSEISLIGCDIPSIIYFDNVPSFSPICFCDPPSFSPIEFGTPPSFNPIGFDAPPSFASICFCDPPSFSPIEFGIPPVISVDWGTPPPCNCTVTLVCPSTTDSAGSGFAATNNYSPPFEDELLPSNWDSIKIENDDINLGIPSEILIKCPKIPPIKLSHDLPTSIDLNIPNIPDMRLVADSSIPTSIRLDGSSVPRSIEIDASHVPEAIKLDASNLPRSIYLEPSQALPSVFRLEAVGIPDKLEVTGIPDSIEVRGFPDFIQLRMPDDPTVKLVYEGPKELKLDIGETLSNIILAYANK